MKPVNQMKTEDAIKHLNREIEKLHVSRRQLERELRYKRFAAGLCFWGLVLACVAVVYMSSN